MKHSVSFVYTIRHFSATTTLVLKAKHVECCVFAWYPYYNRWPYVNQIETKAWAWIMNTKQYNFFFWNKWDIHSTYKQWLSTFDGKTDPKILHIELQRIVSSTLFLELEGLLSYFIIRYILSPCDGHNLLFVIPRKPSSG